LPNPTNYQTDTLNLALNWAGEKGHLTTSYFGSFFKDGYDRLTFQTFAGANKIQTMSTMPSNNFHQLNVSGGYALAEKTKLTGGLSYARNTQNDAYVVDSLAMVVPSPQASLNGLVKTTHADLKLIDQTTKDLALSAGVKYDQRKNSTASNFYNFLSDDGGNPGKFASTPLSIKKTQLELAGDYRLNRDQHLRLAYNRENVKRWCDQYAVSTGIAAGASGYYPAGTNCVVATGSKDDQLSALYKLKATEDVNLSLGYSYSKRKTDSDPYAITARKGTNGNVLGAVPQIWGLNSADFQGFYPVFDASRKEQMLKAGVNWQASQKLSVGLAGRFTDDKYDSTYGVTKGNSWNLNLDATYGYSDDGSISAYLTRQHRQRDMTDLQNSTAVTANNTRINVPAYSTWTDTLKNNDTTIGIGAKQGGLMHSKLELAGDLTYSMGRTAYGTVQNYAGRTLAAGGSLTCSSPQILSCGDLPDITNRMVQFKFTGNYSLDKSSRVAMGYVFQQLKSTDYYFNGLQNGATPNALMPTNQQSGSYVVNVIGASYIYNFK
jgi:MtrB/PioB family decaheme-associated outer membrane protein